ncbi:hypothetical protein BDAP_001881 [Binucleata daphniae]
MIMNNCVNMNVTGDKELFAFLSSAPKEFREGEKIRKYQLKNGDYIHCVLWNMHFYITGTDIVKILVWRFQNAGRSLLSIKKFEEGVFSDLRNLKPGIDATLEGPRSDFLEFLYKNGCIRTQKKQKVFFWYSVPHDALFCDALERDLRRETNIYSYSKYMNNLTGQNYGEIANPLALSPFGKNQQNIKKKNSVKMAARSRRISPQSNMLNQYEINQQPYNANIAPFSMQPVIKDPHDYLSYNVFSPTAPDPFTSFGPVPPNYCYGELGFEDAYSLNNIQFGRFEGCPPENKQKYKMPEFLKQSKEKEVDDKSYKKQSNVAQNITNINGKPQK